MGYLFNSGTGFLANAVTTASNVRSYLINKGGYLVDTIRVGISDFGSRVLDDGGTIEAYDDASASYRDVTKTLYDQASIVLFPSGYKDNLLYSHKPTDGSGDFTFTRGTDTATRVNKDGYIEKERVNLFEQSNSFDTSPWGLDGSTITGGQSGYDGTNDAWLFTKTGSFDGLNQGGLSVNGVSTISIYAKLPSGETDTNQVLFRIDHTGGNFSVTFNLTNSSIPNVSGNSIAADKIDVGNGWYRCVLSVNSNIEKISFRPALNGSTSVTTGSLLYQDAQLEQGLVATDYIETTTAPVYAGITDNIPRLDYSTGAACLLLEPSSTNELQHSEYVSTWAQNTADITLSDNLSPEGYKNCWRVEGTASGTQVGVATFNRIQGATYTTSIWIRKVSGSDTAIFKDVNNNSTTIDITTEWKRHTLTSTTSTTTARLYVSVQNVGDVIEVYGAQLEQGSYPTSYIPTYGSAQTRANENSTASNVIDADNDFTFYFESTLQPEGFTDKYFDAPLTFAYLSGYTVANNNLRHRFGGTNYGFTAPEGVFKYLIRKDSTNMKIYLNGTLEHTITTLPTGTGDLEIQRGQVHKTLYFPTALSDNECRALTAL